MKDVIIIENVREKKKLSKDIADIIAAAEVARALSLVNLIEKYIWQ